ncbi:beta-N-acetylhexosaminidase [Thalassotalea sp. LPB0316]|uniref:beta-N-acetylhexosaminidase n=1 Tax=Thalassotalea sp. LPB0316 TaxID=2769490 RepID=UPI001866B98C|nr:beta-N-acetylhexosaminidase [Thalassotalea sp. LPB0316]QOL27119.1 beta-N-acetylhexosaminidase [Thalassotalea sp. LPB0316]
MGPLMIDVQGTQLSGEDKELLKHPLVGGIILFSRNYESPQQVSQLTQAIRQAAGQPLLIAVDHEGGRVQRFRDQFTAIPAMYDLWRSSGESLATSQQYAYACGYVMAIEVIAVGIDISFAPVLDINNISEVIGNRAFHHEPTAVADIAKYFIKGMHDAGMKATGKHFPGHGSVKEDSHVALPIDKRERSTIFQHDMLPFKQLIADGNLDAIMPAHVIYPDVDKDAVGFSRYWLHEVLRKSLGFNGVVFSDDLTMAGAHYIGGYVERAEAAQQAGCDMLLVCNSRSASIEIIDNANLNIDPLSQTRLAKLIATQQHQWTKMTTNQNWQQYVEVVNRVHELTQK